MTPAEALEILGLEAGVQYTEEDLEEAVRRAKLRAQSLSLVSPARTDEAQERAMTTLRQIPEAEKTLRGLIQGGTFCVPRASAASSTSGATAATGTGASGRRKGGRAGPSRARRVWNGIVRAVGGAGGFLTALPKNRAVRELAGAAGKLCRAFWESIKAIGGHARRKEYGRALLTAFVVAGVAWGTFSLVTGGAEDFAGRVRRAVKAANDYVVSIVRGEGPPASGSHPTVEVSSDVSEEVTLEIDGKPASELNSIQGGTRRIRVRTRGETLYSGRLNFPRGGRVELQERGRGVELTIQWKGGEKWLALNTSQKNTSP